MLNEKALAEQTLTFAKADHIHQRMNDIRRTHGDDSRG